jgi:hypothetical protein
MIGCFIPLLAQIKPPNTPQVQHYAPVSPTQSYTPPISSPGYNNSGAYNAQSIIDQQNKQALLTMGYKAPPTQQQIKQNQSFNQFQLSKQEQQRKEVYDIIRESGNTLASFQSEQQFLAITYNFKQAYAALETMLENDIIDLKKAVFLVEQAYADTLSYPQFTAQIKIAVTACKQIIIKEKLNASDPLTINYAIHNTWAALSMILMILWLIGIGTKCL